MIRETAISTQLNDESLRSSSNLATLLASIRAFRFAWQGQVFTLGASIGVAAVGAESRDLESVLAAADTACYMAKDKGRNRVQVYSEGDEEVSARHGQMGWFSRITRCVEEERFFLHCQQVVSLAPGHGEEYRTERHKADDAVMDHEGNGIERIERQQHFRMPPDLR